MRTATNYRKTNTIYDESRASLGDWLRCYANVIRQNPRAWLKNHPLLQCEDWKAQYPYLAELMQPRPALGVVSDRMAVRERAA
jgi:hypothetical protein